MATAAATDPQPGSGYRLAASDGGVFAFGEAVFEGSMGGTQLNQPIVGKVADPLSGGYWLVASDGGIFSFGGARYFGSTGGVPLSSPVVGMAPTLDGLGYWLVASDGGVFAFGLAEFRGSTGGTPVSQPMVGMAADPASGGYWLVAADGGIFAFGGARYFGSTGGVPLTSPVVGMALSADGSGYWLDAADGGIFAFGAASFKGSMGGTPLNEPIVGMAADRASGGYWLVASDGGIFAFGGARYFGSTGGVPLTSPVVGMAPSGEAMAPGFPEISNSVVAVPSSSTTVVPPGAATSSSSAPHGEQTVALGSGAVVPKPGGALVVPPSDAIPTGVLAAVTKVTTDAAGTAVTTTPTDANSAYDRLDVSVSEDSAAEAGSASADPDRAVAAAFSLPSISLGMFRCTPGAGPQITGSLDLTKVHTELSFSPRGPALSFLVVASPKMKFSASFTGKVSCSYEGNAGVPIVLSATPPIAVQFGTKLEFTADGSLSMNYEAAPRITFGFVRGAYGNSDARGFSWNSTSGFSASAGASAFGGISAYLSLGGVVGVETTFGPVISVEVQACPSGGTKTTAKVGLKIEADVKISAWVKNWTFAIAEVTFGTKQIYSGACPAAGGGGGSPPSGGGGGGLPPGGGGGGGGTPPGGGGGGSSPTVSLAQGPAAPAGFRYAITLRGFVGGSRVTISCRDSVDPGGFFTFSLTTDGSGSASTSSQCYSGDGPDHWVIANGGLESNHVRWGGGSAPPPVTPPPPSVATYAETAGGAANTWTNHTNAGGLQGPTIARGQTVQIACKLQGFRVADGNTWWYRIAQSPWNNAYYVSADAFYNNGQTSGSLLGTPFVDPAVRDC